MVLAGPSPGNTDPRLLLVAVTQPAQGVEVRGAWGGREGGYLLVALLVAGTARGELTEGLLHPVDTFVQITDKLVAQLGAVRVVYTGNLLQQIPNM